MSKRIPMIAGNWKMYKTVAEAAEEAAKLVDSLGKLTGRQAMIAPPFTALSAVSKALKESPVSLGAQNLFFENEGAFTGEISAPMLVSVGCSHVIIGHSERRQYFGETDETVRKKIGAALQHGLTPVVCVGESEAERDGGKTFSVLDKQISKGLNSLLPEEIHKLIIAYEPVWAIGTGKTATPEIAQEAHRFIRELVEKKFGDAPAEAVRILYGGSVKPDNIGLLMEKPDIDGALVGGASLKAESFRKIIEF